MTFTLFAWLCSAQIGGLQAVAGTNYLVILFTCKDGILKDIKSILVTAVPKQNSDNSSRSLVVPGITGLPEAQLLSRVVMYEQLFS